MPLAALEAPMALAPSIHDLLGEPASIAIDAFDGSSVHPPDASVTVYIRRPSALVRMITAPGELGVVRAFVSGDADVEGDLFELLAKGFTDRPDLTRRAIVRL